MEETSITLSINNMFFTNIFAYKALSSSSALQSLLITFSIFLGQFVIWIVSYIHTHKIERRENI